LIEIADDKKNKRTVPVFGRKRIQNEKKELNLTETIINLETVNPIEFFGVNNGKLDILKKKFPLLKILSRGTQIKLSGSPEQVETAKEKIDLLVQYLERNGHVSENYFQQILGGDDAEVIDNFVDRHPNDILVFGPNGKSVRARTVNQKRMVGAVDKNDIVFAIGPASGWSDTARRNAHLQLSLGPMTFAHALARLPEICGEIGKDGVVVLNLSGRGDKDLATVAARLGVAIGTAA